MKQSFDTIIIGGGLGGLTAGATLAKNSKKVLLLEQHYIPGGCATSFKRKDYVMEVGLHEMDGIFEKDTKNEIFEFLNVHENIEFIQIPELFRYKSKSIDFIHPHGRKEFIRAVIKDYPEEESGINQLMDLMDGVLNEIPRFPTDKWKQKLIYVFMPLLFPNIVKASKKSVGGWLDLLIKNENLKLIIQGSLIYYHDDPYTTSMIYFSIGQSSYINGGGHFIKGGSQKLSSYLAKVIEDNNGQVLLGKKVTKIIIKKGKAVGVSFKDSFNSGAPIKQVFANIIIANAAIPLVKNLLPKKESDKLAIKTDHLKKACALITVYIGFKKQVKDLGCKHYSNMISGDNVHSLHDILENNHSDWNQKNFIFVDYSQIDSQLAPKGKSVGVICAADYLSDWDKLDDAHYKAKKEEVALTLINRLDKVYPGITEHIDYYEVGTAKTVQRYTLNPDGTAYGYAQTPEQSGMGRVPFNSPVKNLFFAGAWTFPGGGFTGAILSGFLCGNKITKQLKTNHIITADMLDDEQTVELIDKKEIAKNTIELTYKKPNNFVYTAGQYAVLDFIDAKYQALDMNIRPLSFVSHPDEKHLRFAMRLSSSSYKKTAAELPTGNYSRIFGPMGNFSIINTNKTIVLLVSGIGITPILPLLKEFEKKKNPQTIHLFYSNKTEEESAYFDTLKATNLTNYNFHPVFTKTQSRINKELLNNKLGPFTNAMFYVVGGSSFIKSMNDLLINNGVLNNNICIDDFG